MSDSRTRNASKNIVFAVIFQIVKLLLVFLSRIIFVKKLGAEYLGINGLFSNVLGILSLADLGMTTALMYSLYKPLAEKNEEKIVTYLNYFKKVYSYIAIVVGVVGISLLPFLKYLVNLPSDIPNIYLYYILLLLNTVISYLFIYKTTLLSADQKMYVINKYDTIFQFVLFGIQILVLIFTNSFTLYLVSNILCTFLGNYFKVKATDKIYPFLKNKSTNSIDNIEKKKIFENLKSLFLYKIGGVIQSNTDNILISIFVGTIAVGYYSNYSTIILSITTFVSIIFTSIKAGIGNYVVSENKEKQLKMFNILEVFNFILIGFTSVCFVVLIPDFIGLCFGEEYILESGILMCAVLNYYTSNIRQTIWTYRETTGIFKKTKYITLITAIVNIVLSIIFGYKWGLTGIILATVVSRMIYAWWKEPQILFNEYFESSPKKYYITYIKRIILMGFILYDTQFICSFINLENIYINFIVKCLVCVSVLTFMFLGLYYKSEAMNFLVSKLKRRRDNE